MLYIYCKPCICTDGVNRKDCWPWGCKDWLTLSNWWFNNLYWCCPSVTETVTCTEMKNICSAMKPSMIFRPVIYFTSSGRWLSQAHKIGFWYENKTRGTNQTELLFICCALWKPIDHTTNVNIDSDHLPRQRQCTVFVKTVILLNYEQSAMLATAVMPPVPSWDLLDEWMWSDS